MNKSVINILVLISLLVLLMVYTFSLPKQIFNKPCSTVLYDKDNNLLCAHIANDGQWRFPHNPEVPLKFAAAAITFEDKNFILHQGVDGRALARAMWQNIQAGNIVSGGSTITMQVVRMALGNQPRTFFQKLKETILATRIELSYSKAEILAMYASNAPFGGNVVGLDAASWRYYARKPDKLSWAEAATLAVLPNSPSLIFPGKNHEELLMKRNQLLEKLMEQEIIDSTICTLAMDEPLPQKPHALPRNTPHLLTRAIKENMEGKRIYTGIDKTLQERVSRIISSHHRELKQNGIHNASALVLDVETSCALAYVGNTHSNIDEHGNDVDMITSRRSPGSILKPLLYAFMLNDGELTPNMLVPDIPTRIAGYAPENYNRTYDGAVPAKNALSRSLNVPAVRMLRDYGTGKFSYNLKRVGITTIDKPASHYGLSIILGGSEVTMWDMAGVFSSMARTLNHYNHYQAKYNKEDFHPPVFMQANTQKKLLDPLSKQLTHNSILNAAAIWYTFEAMVDVSRPEQQRKWELFSSSQKIAWKTGTSYGYRDAWAIGITPKNVVVVWTGNADGEGRPGLIGIKTAAPVLFDIFKTLKPCSWFDKPYDDMQKVTICKQSGHLASEICNDTITTWIQKSGIRTHPCPYHRLIHLDEKGQRVSSYCEEVSNMEHKPWFVLPPAIEWFYKSRHPGYRLLPPYREGCKPPGDENVPMQLIYPKYAAKIFVPTELNGNPGETIFELAHRIPGTTVYWHLDDEYIGKTATFHQIGLRPSAGEHILTIVDENGEKLISKFEVIGEKKGK